MTQARSKNKSIDLIDGRRRESASVSLATRQEANGVRRSYSATAPKRSKRVGIVAVARKLLIALWHYATQGVVPAGAKFKAEGHKFDVPKPRGANKTKLAKIQAALQPAVA